VSSPKDAQDIVLAYGACGVAVPAVVRPLAVVKVGGEVAALKRTLAELFLIIVRAWWFLQAR
jgi:hypothetical protein